MKLTENDKRILAWLDGRSRPSRWTQYRVRQLISAGLIDGDPPELSPGWPPKGVPHRASFPYATKLTAAGRAVLEAK